jgi:hypothetical protein
VAQGLETIKGNKFRRHKVLKTLEEVEDHLSAANHGSMASQVPSVSGDAALNVLQLLKGNGENDVAGWVELDARDRPLNIAKQESCSNNLLTRELCADVLSGPVLVEKGNHRFTLLDRQSNNMEVSGWRKTKLGNIYPVLHPTRGTVCFEKDAPTGDHHHSSGGVRMVDWGMSNSSTPNKDIRLHKILSNGQPLGEHIQVTAAAPQFSPSSGVWRMVIKDEGNGTKDGIHDVFIRFNQGGLVVSSVGENETWYSFDDQPGKLFKTNSQPTTVTRISDCVLAKTPSHLKFHDARGNPLASMHFRVAGAVSGEVSAGSFVSEDPSVLFSADETSWNHAWKQDSIDLSEKCVRSAHLCAANNETGQIAKTVFWCHNVGPFGKHQRVPSGTLWPHDPSQHVMKDDGTAVSKQGQPVLLLASGKYSVL